MTFRLISFAYLSGVQKKDKPKRENMNRIGCALLMALCGQLPASGESALTGGSGRGVPGGQAVVSISLNSDPPIAGIQFELKEESEHLILSEIALSSVLVPEHRMVSNEVLPGVHRAVIYSPGNTPLGNGEILLLTFLIGQNAPPGVEAITLGSQLLVNPDAGIVSETNVQDGRITISDTPPPSVVTNRRLFYNDSAFDLNSDDDAIATDKVALLPGARATFENLSSYHKGINGVLIDIQDLPDPVNVSGTDFEFTVGNSADLGSWTPAPNPIDLTIVADGGLNGSDRIRFVWENHAIKSQWLGIRIRAGERTGLLQDDEFYFGNAPGETGNSPNDTKVDISDENAARQNPRNFLNPAPVTSAHDFNRDRFVDISDENIARQNATNFLTALALLDLSAANSAARQRAVAHSGTHQRDSEQGQVLEDETVRRSSLVFGQGDQPRISVQHDPNGRRIEIIVLNATLETVTLQRRNDLFDGAWGTVEEIPDVRRGDRESLTWSIERDQRSHFFRVIRLHSAAAH